MTIPARAFTSDTEFQAAFPHVPTDDQRTLMSQTWSETSVNQDGTNAVVGMFGNDDGYYFYMEFEPNQADEWWDPRATGELKFTMLFQMGET